MPPETTAPTERVLTFTVTPQEDALIADAMAVAGFRTRSAYLRATILLAARDLLQDEKERTA